MENLLTNLFDQLTYHPGEPMLFSSGVFWALFIVFLPVYAMLKSRMWQMVVFVVAFSFFFYYKSSGYFVALLGGTSVIDWTLSRVLTRLKSRKWRLACVWVSIVCSLSILGYFKYANFFLWNFNAMVGSNFAPLEIILPVGISFYTFQSISYIVDVYKGRVAPTATWLEYVFFLSFFPALVAGPIVRADYFLPQIRENRVVTRREVYVGFWLILLGIIKKAIIADYIAQYNDLIFDIDPVNGPGYSGFETFMGIIGYTMQIYCDFSGYSDMAIGIALIMGFKLAVNFNFPYKSTNVTEFWRRWHISLSTWLRDYVYIPLGGNRKGTVRTYINNFLTMLIGGLWHGASWKFVFWGAMHGGGLALHKATKPHIERLGQWTDSWPVRAFFWIITFCFVAALWVFFRADSFSDSWIILKHAVTDFSWDYAVPFVTVRWLWLLLMYVIIVAHFMPEGFWNRVGDRFVESPWFVKLVVFIIVIQLVLELRGEDVAPFIYFQF